MKHVRHMKSLFFLILFFGINIQSTFGHADFIVDSEGSGDYLTITDAVNALAMYPYQRTIIFIKNGVYEEKIRIEQNYITLRGESRDSTIIRYSQLRSDWVENKDYIGPAVVNIHGDDIILDNLTIENTQSEIGPHAFAVYGTGTRTILVNCSILSNGADTVSLWNYKHGMYYHSNCTFRGAVDFVCPRGCCFIRDSKFYEVKKTAAIWHAGHYHKDQKFVLRSCYFDGVEGFQLGRNHYEAQFYLLDCQFSSKMANQPIYRVLRDDPSQDNPYFWGDRKYFYNCQKHGETFDWYFDNLEKAPGNPTPEDDTPAWTFNGRWDPESINPPEIIDYSIKGKSLFLTFNEIVTVRGHPFLKNKSGKKVNIVIYRFTDSTQLQFDSDTTINIQDISGDLVLENGELIGSIASVYERSVGSMIRLNH